MLTKLTQWRTFCIFTKRWRHRIESCSNRFQNTITLQKELVILCWRLLLVNKKSLPYHYTLVFNFDYVQIISQKMNLECWQFFDTKLKRRPLAERWTSRHQDRPKGTSRIDFRSLEVLDTDIWCCAYLCCSNLFNFINRCS